MEINEIIEFNWIKENKDMLSDKDIVKLKELRVFEYMNRYKLKVPLMDFIVILNTVDDMIRKYEV